VRHSVLSLFRQRLYQIIAGYEDANDADRLRHDPAFQILADQPLGEPLGSQPTLSRWENSPSPRGLLKLQDALLDWFVRTCGKQVRKRGEILMGHNQTIGIIAHKLCRLVWKILHRGIRYEERGPEVSKASKQKRTRKMIQALRRLGYQIEPSLPQSAITA
jgi:Transposase DDE domain group 1